MSFQINNSNAKAYLLLTLAALFWSGNFIVGKAASFYEIPPFSLNFYRWLFAFLILFPFTFKEVLSNKNYIFQNIGLFFLLGITSITIFNLIFLYIAGSHSQANPSPSTSILWKSFLGPPFFKKNI